MAVCPQTKEILIFATNNDFDCNKWTLLEVLTEHYANVSSLDWHKDTNRLLSASYDRSCIVWEQSAQSKFIPQQCVTRELIANTDS